MSFARRAVFAFMANQSLYVYVDQYVTIEAGEPFRLFPFGTIVRGDDRREVTPQNAGTFTLPHFKPPIKRGSHDEDAPALGFITGLDVRTDGIYAIPEYTEAGLEALANGEFRYQSPEVIWDGVLENADGGGTVEGNIIMGAALLHTPALGEAAAFFEATAHDAGQESGGDSKMSDTATIPVSWLDKMLGREPQEPQPQTPQAGPGNQEDFAALTEKIDKFQAQLEEVQEERDDYKAKAEKLEAQEARAERVATFAAEFSDTPAEEDGDLHELLADIEDEDLAGKLTTRVKAYAAQVDQSLEQDIGASGGDAGGSGSLQVFETAVQDKMEEESMTRSEAYRAVIRENGDLYREALGNE